MTEFVGYIAMSIDARIADGDGGMDWLHAFDNLGTDFGYAEFYDGIDALVMGRTTYDQLRDMPEWPYAGKPVHVVTRHTFAPGRAGVIPVPPDFPALRAHLEDEGYARVWIVGGGVTQRAALDAGMFDTAQVFVMPVVVGSGPLVFGDGPTVRARMTSHRIWPHGVAELGYDFRKEG